MMVKYSSTCMSMTGAMLDSHAARSTGLSKQENEY